MLLPSFTYFSACAKGLNSLKDILRKPLKLRPCGEAICNLFRIYPLSNIGASSASPSLLEGGREAWKDEVVKLAVKACRGAARLNILCYSRGRRTPRSPSEALRAPRRMAPCGSLPLGLSEGLLRCRMLWFGDTSAVAKKEVRRVSTQVNRLLSNVDYVYPGKQCKENVYAYVHPNPPYNKPLGLIRHPLKLLST